MKKSAVKVFIVGGVIVSCFLWMQFHLVNGSSPARVWSTKALSFHTNVTDNSILSNNNGTAATLIRKIGESTAVPIRKDTRTTQYPTISILVELTGELGNHLHHLAHGRVLQNIAGTFGIPTRLVLRRQSNAEKYKQTQKHLQKCFPNLRNFTFHHDTSKVTSQTSTSGNMTQMFHSRLRLHGGSNYSVTHRAVDALHQILQLEQQVATASDSQYPKLGLSTPFLHTSSMLSRELMNLYYDDFREFFAFDDSACCSDVPGPNEAVFHFRNFGKELKKAKQKGLEELSPHKVATELFPKQDRNNTDTNITGIAIATRFGRDGATQEYITALSQNGYTVRWMQGHSAMYDFCAMRRSTELVGIVRSTFVVWAALLGHGRARLYSVKSPVTVEKSTRMGNPYFRTYNWSHPELKRRIQFELYQSEAMDEQQPQ